jgi:hypothetical protein
MKKHALYVERISSHPGQPLNENNWTALLFNQIHQDKGFNLPLSGDFAEFRIPKTGQYEFDIWANSTGAFEYVASALEVNGQLVKNHQEAEEVGQASNQGKIYLVKGQIVRAMLAIVSSEENGSFHHYFSLVRVS